MTPLIRFGFGTLSAVAPKLAGKAAHWLFTTPLKTGRLTPAEKRLETRAEAKLREAEDIGFQSGDVRIAAYRFGHIQSETAKRIVLVHGWMSGARYMLAMVDPLIAAGHEVICLDLPAHGTSGGKSTNLVQCAKALDILIKQLGDVDIIIAHSFGGAVTAYALSRLTPGALGNNGKIILLASPNQLSSVTQSFSKSFGLNVRAQSHYEQILTSTIGESLEEMDGNLMYAKAGYPISIVHCVDDTEVSIEQSRRYLAMGDLVELIELSGLGHRRILYHPKALAAISTAVG